MAALRVFVPLAALAFLLGSSCKKAAEPGHTEPAPGTTPAWLAEHQLLVYGNAEADYLRTLGATGATWYAFFGGVNEADKAYVKRLQKAGFRVFGNFATMQGYEHFDPEPGIEERSACRTLSGDKATMYWSFERPPPWITCNNNPEWVALLERRMKDQVRTGVDGIHIDEVEGIAGFLFAAGFCPYCMAGFREHLRENYPDAADRQSRFGISDLDTFDYGAYLRGLGKKQISEDPNRDLRREFVLFQLLARRRHLESLVQLAKKEGGRNLAVSANVTFLGSHKQIFLPILDLAVYEAFMKKPPQDRHLTFHLWGSGMDPGKRFVIFPVSTDMLGLTADDGPLIAHWMLEALAGGQSFLVPYEAYTGFGPRYTVPAEPLAPVGAFLRDYGARFGHGGSAPAASGSCQEGISDVRGGCRRPEPIAEVGLLYDLATGLDQYIEKGYELPVAPGDMEKSLLGIGRALEEAHIPYRVIYSGDGRFVQRVPSGEELRELAAVVVPDARSLLPETRQRLVEYRESGGRLVPVGDLGAQYRDGGEPAVRDQVVSTVRSALSRYPLETSAGPDVAVVPWRSGDRLLVHLLNYDYDESGRTFIPAADVKVWLQLPAGFDPAGRRLTVESPWEEAKPLFHEISEGGVRFTLPSLQAYALLVFE